jgi:hypothetical protein
MKRILKWLETKFCQHSAAVEEEYSVSGDTTVVQPKLSVRYKSSLDASESTGFDPYNSGSFGGSKAWQSHSPK